MDVAGHSFRTGKPSCHPSRTQAPPAVEWQPTPHPPNAKAGPVTEKINKMKLRQRRITICSLRITWNQADAAGLVPSLEVGKPGRHKGDTLPIGSGPKPG
jgi:hypothetical protein